MKNKFNDKYKVQITSENYGSLQSSANNKILDLVSNIVPFYNEDVKSYLHNVIATIILEHNKYYEGFNITVPYRIKSRKSIKEKILDFFSNKSKFTYDNKKDSFNFSFNRDIRDIFAMKIVATNNRPTFSSSDPELKDLIEEKKSNHEFLCKMQEFKFQLINSEFENPPKYKYDVSKKEYYEHCKILLKRIKTLIAPEATKLHENYDKQIVSIDETIALLDSMRYLNNTISKKDFMPNSDINFLNILNDFELRIHDKLNLAVLTNQIESIFKNSSVLKTLGVELVPGMKRKRTSNGYVSNFIYIKTLVGTFECQLQSAFEYTYGNHGPAAHNTMEGKNINAPKIPDPNNPEEIKKFYNYALYVSPESYSAQLDTTIEEDRVIIHKASGYQNFKNIVGQVPKTSKRYTYLHEYFNQLYPIRNKIFKNDGSEFGIMRSDIIDYINSNIFKQLPKLITNIRSPKKEDTQK